MFNMPTANGFRWVAGLVGPGLVGLVLLPCFVTERARADQPPAPVLEVLPTEDFQVTGDGQAAAWKKVPWTNLGRNQGELPYRARFKMLYSKTGVYVLMEGTDSRVTATMSGDFDDLWKEDAFEFFFWTDERYPVYFEYEISPLNRELPLLIPNLDGKRLGWRPWHYEADRKTQKAVAFVGGRGESGSKIAGWSAEVYVPYQLLTPLPNVPPVPGTKWRANFYRLDHDQEQKTSWSWARVGSSFHEYQKYGTLLFR
jgi:hypothetical protein